MVKVGDSMTISFILVQIAIICVFAHCLLIERKYCKHLDWWSDVAAYLIFIPCLIPMLGIFISLAGIVDCTRNTIEELCNRNR